MIENPRHEILESNSGPLAQAVERFKKRFGSGETADGQSGNGEKDSKRSRRFVNRHRRGGLAAAGIATAGLVLGSPHPTAIEPSDVIITDPSAAADQIFVAVGELSEQIANQSDHEGPVTITSTQGQTDRGLYWRRTLDISRPHATCTIYLQSQGPSYIPGNPPFIGNPAEVRVNEHGLYGLRDERTITFRPLTQSITVGTRDPETGEISNQSFSLTPNPSDSTQRPLTEFVSQQEGILAKQIYDACTNVENENLLIFSGQKSPAASA